MCVGLVGVGKCARGVWQRECKRRSRADACVCRCAACCVLPFRANVVPSRSRLLFCRAVATSVCSFLHTCAAHRRRHALHTLISSSHTTPEQVLYSRHSAPLRPCRARDAAPSPAPPRPVNRRQPPQHPYHGLLPLAQTPLLLPRQQQEQHQHGGRLVLAFVGLVPVHVSRGQHWRPQLEGAYVVAYYACR